VPVAYKFQRTKKARLHAATRLGPDGPVFALWTLESDSKSDS